MSNAAAQDHVWQALGRYPVRRAMLGRERCDAIAAVTAGQIERSGVDYRQAGDATYVRDVCRLVERRVKSVYDQNCGMAFTTLLILWAISTIVQILVYRWFNTAGGNGS
jgi:hypothetical protein